MIKDRFVKLWPAKFIDNLYFTMLLKHSRNVFELLFYAVLDIIVNLFKNQSEKFWVACMVFFFVFLGTTPVAASLISHSLTISSLSVTLTVFLF